MNNKNQYPEMLFEDKAPSRERIENRLADLKVRYQNLLFELNNSNILDIDKIFVHRDSKDYDFNSEKVIDKINENIDIQEKVSALQKSITNRLANIEKLNEIEFNKHKYEDLKNEVERTLTQFNNINNDYPIEQKIVVDNSQNIDLIIEKMDSMAKELGEKINDLIISQDETNEFKEEILILRSQIQDLLTENVDYKNKVESLIRENNFKEMELSESFKAWTRNTNKLDELESLLNIQKDTIDDYDLEKNDLINFLEGKVNELKIENYESAKNKENENRPEKEKIINNQNDIFLNINRETDKKESTEDTENANVSLLDDEINQKRMLVLEFSNDISKMIVSLEEAFNQINFELKDCSQVKNMNIESNNLTIDFSELKDELDKMQAYDSISLSTNSYNVINVGDLINIITRIKDLLFECKTFIEKTETEIKNYFSKADFAKYPIVLEEFNKYYESCLRVKEIIDREIDCFNCYLDLYKNDDISNFNLEYYNQSSWIRVKDLINHLFEKNRTLYKLFFKITYLRDITTDIDLDIDNQKIIKEAENKESIIDDSNYPHTLFETSSLIDIPKEQIYKTIPNKDFEEKDISLLENKNKIDIDEKLNEFKEEINVKINDLAEKLLYEINLIGANYTKSENKNNSTIDAFKNRDNYELIKNLKLKVVLTELEKIKKEIDLYENQELSDVLNHMN